MYFAFEKTSTCMNIDIWHDEKYKNVKDVPKLKNKTMAVWHTELSSYTNKNDSNIHNNE